ncbi:MAG: hypothetical protein R3B81_07115 [bacterium]
MRRARRLPFVSLALLFVPGCDRLPTGPPEGASQLRTRGVTIADWTAGGVASAAGLSAIDEIAATGADTIVFVVSIEQDTATSPAPDPETTPRPDAFLVAAAHARGLGLAVGVKLHVEVRDGTWRAMIRPEDPATWFTAYREVVRSWADAATAADAAWLAVGTELAGTCHLATEWRRVIVDARERFDGALTYAASWDEAERVTFWDALDFVGVDAYWPVAARRDPSRLDALAAWQPWLARVEALARRADRDVVFTEIGYRSCDGAGMYPSDFQSPEPADPGEQEDLYWAALQAIADTPNVAGIWWWSWELGTAGTGGPDDTGYTPRGKPALDVLTTVWSSP